MREEVSDEELAQFSRVVRDEGRRLWREFPWRETRDPYEIWISEVMLQQTQVSRVDGRWQRWLSRFPTLTVLAQASAAEVLEEWQGLGYNRRALALLRAANEMLAQYDGVPCGERELCALPGIGPTTAAGIRAFAYNLPGVYLDTNVRTVFLHELFPGEEGVSDKLLKPLVARACPDGSDDEKRGPRAWYYALLDYGAFLKKTVPNPSRRSASHVVQSKFEGSRRQKRAELLRQILAAGPHGATLDMLHAGLMSFELASGRDAPSLKQTAAIVNELASEGFCTSEGERWRA